MVVRVQEKSRLSHGKSMANPVCTFIDERLTNFSSEQKERSNGNMDVNNTKQLV